MTFRNVFEKAIGHPPHDFPVDKRDPSALLPYDMADLKVASEIVVELEQLSVEHPDAPIRDLLEALLRAAGGRASAKPCKVEL